MKNIVLSSLLILISFLTLAEEIPNAKTNRVKFTLTALTVSNSTKNVVYINYYLKPVICIVHCDADLNKSTASIDSSKSDKINKRLIAILDLTKLNRENINPVQLVNDTSILNKTYANISNLKYIDIYILKNAASISKLSFDVILAKIQTLSNDIKEYSDINYQINNNVLLRIDDNVVNINIADFDAYMLKNIVEINNTICISNNKTEDKTKVCINLDNDANTTEFKEYYNKLNNSSLNILDLTEVVKNNIDANIIDSTIKTIDNKLNYNVLAIEKIISQYNKFNNTNVIKITDNSIASETLIDLSSTIKSNDLLMNLLIAMNSITNDTYVSNNTTVLNSLSNSLNSVKININAYKQLREVLAYESCNNLANTLAENKSASYNIRLKAKKIQFMIYSLKELNYRVKSQKPDKSMFDFGSVYWLLYKEYEEATNDLDREIIIDWIQAQLESEFKSRSRKLKIIEK